jgi:hypothetical protein
MILVSSAKKAEKLLEKPDLRQDFFRELLDLGVAPRIPESLVVLEHASGFYFLEMLPGFCGVHVLTYPDCRGKMAVEAGKQVIRWVFANLSPVVRARIQKERKNVQLFATMCGMTCYSEDSTHRYYEVVQCH